MAEFLDARRQELLLARMTCAGSVGVGSGANSVGSGTSSGASAPPPPPPPPPPSASTSKLSAVAHRFSVSPLAPPISDNGTAARPHSRGSDRPDAAKHDWTNAVAVAASQLNSHPIADPLAAAEKASDSQSALQLRLENSVLAVSAGAMANSASGALVGNPNCNEGSNLSSAGSASDREAPDTPEKQTVAAAACGSASGSASQPAAGNPMGQTALAHSQTKPVSEKKRKRKRQTATDAADGVLLTEAHYKTPKAERRIDEFFNRVQPF